MKIDNLWEKLSLPATHIVAFKKDIAEGKVPELPFFIIGQEKLKAAVKSKIEEIDSDRMVTNLIIADFGNGKTNLLKYLQLFFNTYDSYNISVEYSRADIERTDIVLFLLKILQDKYIDKIVDFVQGFSDIDSIGLFTNNFESNFREIEEYTKLLFREGNSREEIIEIFYLGTGRFYNKRYFDRWKIDQIRDFNRREILVLFLNILSKANTYLVFAIDEIEKIREKSKLRFNHFLTSYRELVDLFNQIKGHYLMVSFTTGVGESEISTANDALYTRIKPDILQIAPLTTKQDIESLITYLNELFATGKNVDDIFSAYSKNKSPNNRLAIQRISSLLYAQETDESLEEILKKSGLEEEFNETLARLEDEEAFKNLHRKFFDPLEFYLESVESEGNVKKQDRYYIDDLSERISYFIFNNYLEDFNNERIKIEKLRSENPEHAIAIFSPEKLELTFSELGLHDENVEIIDYDPKSLFVLLELYRDNYDLQPTLNELIIQYTKQKI